MPHRVYFAYVQPISFSGQSAASDLIIEKLAERDWDCRRLPIYPLDRSIANRFARYAYFIFQQFKTWRLFLGLACARKPVLHLNLGQSMASFVRIGMPYFLVRGLRRGMRVVVSLHGSIFMQWERDSRETRVFRWFLNSAALTTVLGDKQKAKLVQLGIPESKIKVVPNTCELDIMDDEAVSRKHRADGPVRILHLSLLIESKGYPEFLEALEKLASQPLPQPLDAVLCGPLSYSAHCTRFTNDADKQRWIEDKITAINAVPNTRVTVRWIPGARGEEKQRLFKDAQVFVFPSLFPVEAQPLVLLEALASGCSLITSTVGEIPSTVNPDCACLLEEVSTDSVASAMESLAADAPRRERLALNGVERMRGPFSARAYADTWETIFNELSE